ncbi:hypothetical protein [Nitrosospira sp. Nsp1]|uniref:DUF7281 domain-containing protein n=1 Tax=Nitrosospira sp. Nsp1 TaxID=136547 RepID=UPI000885DD08|nr:hypothetical protein [Nitrosospira sp. Nsp1]SCX55335.1 hypothetical protein SAMN05720354_11560 [Nitrosospira sp. Nsp1]
MDKRLINTLLRIFHSLEIRFPSGRSISAFCSEYNLGIKQGASLVFTEEDKKEIGRMLQGEMGIDPAMTTSESWKHLGRSQSLQLARDEKFAGRSVGAGRLRLKTLPGQTLHVAGGSWDLPLRTDLGLDLEVVLGHEIGHDALLVIENLQTFDDIHDVDVAVMDSLPARDPLVIYRGDTQGGARTDAIHTLIESTILPVYAFVDYDPAGLVIASGLPRLAKVLAPSLHDLGVLIQMHGIAKRYLEQVATASHVLQQFKADSRIAPLWSVIHAAGKGLPQEYFHSRST